MNFEKYGQYKNDIFNKLGFNFDPRKKILDVGCGDGSDAIIFLNEFGLNVCGIDIYKDKNIESIEKLDFKEASIYSIPFAGNSFDYVFLHDVLHHIDERNQSYDAHVKGLLELGRILKKGGTIVILEGNRYNPLFYPHMVKMRGHNHWKQSYFMKIIQNVFDDKNYDISFKFFEAHCYPSGFLYFWKIYESMMEKFIPKDFLAYNTVIIKKNE
jgi:ubiquinone/menaquinone biosynthesis C-methylase UbiE